MSRNVDLVVLYEHPAWQESLFAALTKRGIRFEAFDLKRAAFADTAAPRAPLYFNQASPSAYVRGNHRAVPMAWSYMCTLELAGARVLNGSQAFALELSKSAQAALMQRLGIRCPRSIAFNHVDALAEHESTLRFPLLLKPEQGGSGARIQIIESLRQLRELLEAQPEIWLPDNLLLLQEYFPTDPSRGIVRMEFVGGELLYAMRVISHGRFNLCPAPICNPDSPDEASACEIPATPEKPVEFYPYPDVPAEAVEMGKRIMKAGGLDVGGIEYLENEDGQLVFYDINANSNLRPSIAQSFGFDPFERVVDFLASRLAETPSLRRTA